MLIPIGVSAQTLTSKTKTNAQVVSTQKDSARAPYASQIKSERQTIKNNYNTNKTIRDAIKGKLVQVKTLITQDKTNKTLKAKKTALKAQTCSYKGGQSYIKNY